MKSLVIVATMVAVLVVTGAMTYAARSAASADPTAEVSRGLSPSGAIAAPEEFMVGDRYIVPALPATALDRIPATEAVGDRYLAERVALADLVVGERILAAEDLANDYAHELPGFAAVLLVDGFSQDADGTWFYDRYSSWMRFPLMASAVCWPSVPSRCAAVACC
jgi:hypothetical protein